MVKREEHTWRKVEEEKGMLLFSLSLSLSVTFAICETRCCRTTEQRFCCLQVFSPPPFFFVSLLSFTFVSCRLACLPALSSREVERGIKLQKCPGDGGDSTGDFFLHACFPS